jgi:hypothetical protein
MATLKEQVEMYLKSSEIAVASMIEATIKNPHSKKQHRKYQPNVITGAIQRREHDSNNGTNSI